MTDPNPNILTAECAVEDKNVVDLQFVDRRFISTYMPSAKSHVYGDKTYISRKNPLHFFSLGEYQDGVCAP